MRTTLSLGRVVPVLVLLVCGSTLSADEAKPAADDARQWLVWPDGAPPEADAIRFNIDACLAESAKRTDPISKADWEARRGQIDRALRKCLALEPEPERTPLEATVTGRTEREGYTIENLVFQSRPKFYVTANVHRPADAEGRLPAVVVTAGHAMEKGKNNEPYLAAQRALALQGFVVLGYDPIGQGERRAPGNAHNLGYAAGLVGQCNLTYMLWDTSRAMDYLASRDDVDPARIGVAGNSGGGLNTMYAMPFDERFAAGASFCCLCSFRDWIKDGGNHCICNHVPGIVRYMEQFEFVGLCAPRPFMSGNAVEDKIFPIAGVRDTMRRARPIYGFYDAEDRLALSEGPGGHGWSQPLREAAYGWLAQWLHGRGDGSPLAEPEMELDDWQAPEVLALRDGKLPADAKSYLDLVREEAERLIAALPPVPEERDEWIASMRARLWDVLGGRPDVDAPKAKSLGSFMWNGHQVERLAIETEPGIVVPALWFRSAYSYGAAPTVVVLDDQGKSGVAKYADLRTTLDRGAHVLALDPRATGEVAPPNPNAANHGASDAVILGRPLLAQQAWDVIAAMEYLAARPEVAEDRMALLGWGNVGLIATTAAALSDRPRAVVSAGSIASFTDALGEPLPLPLWAYPTHILTVADVPQLEAMHQPGRFLRLDDTNAASIDRAAAFLEQALSW